MKKMSFLVPVIAAATLVTGCNDLLCLAPPGTTATTKLTICHVAGKDKFTLVTVAAASAQSHIDHGDFLAPAGAKKASDCVVPVVVPPPPPPPPPPAPPAPPAPTPTPDPTPGDDEAAKKLDEGTWGGCLADDSHPSCLL